MSITLPAKTPAEQLALLAKIPLFRNVQEHVIKKIREQGFVVNYPPHQLLLNENTLNNKLRIILDGEAKIFLPVDDTQLRRAREIPLAFIGIGDIFGEYSSLEGLPSRASVRSESSLTVLEIAGDKIAALTQADTSFGLHLYRNLATITINNLHKTNLKVTGPNLIWF